MAIWAASHQQDHSKTQTWFIFSPAAKPDIDLLPAGWVKGKCLSQARELFHLAPSLQPPVSLHSPPTSQGSDHMTPTLPSPASSFSHLHDFSIKDSHFFWCLSHPPHPCHLMDLSHPFSWSSKLVYSVKPVGTPPSGVGLSLSCVSVLFCILSSEHLSQCAVIFVDTAISFIRPCLIYPC